MWWMNEWESTNCIIVFIDGGGDGGGARPGLWGSLSFCASRLRRWCVVVAVLFVAEQNVRTVVVTSACLLACSLSLCLCLLPVVVVVLQQLPFPVWRSGLLLFLLFRIAPGVLPFSMQFFALCRSHVVEFDFLFSLISLTISTPRSGLSHELASRVFLC